MLTRCLDHKMEKVKCDEILGVYVEYTPPLALWKRIMQGMFLQHHGRSGSQNQGSKRRNVERTGCCIVGARSAKHSPVKYLIKLTLNWCNFNLLVEHIVTFL